MALTIKVTTMSDKSEAQVVLEERVGKLVAKATIRSPFIAAMTCRLPRVYVEEEWATAFTDGSRIGFGAKFCSSLNDNELLFVVMHESMHVVLMHMWRRNGRDSAVFNIANDAIINAILVSEGFEMPTNPDGSPRGVLIDWVTTDMDSEEVYYRLMKDAKERKKWMGEGKGGGKQNGETGGGGWDKKGDLADSPDPAAEADARAAVLAAAKMAKACGTGGALVDRIIGADNESSVSWVERLRTLMTTIARNDYSYRRWSRRMYSSASLVVPTLYSEAMGGVLIAVDTSGSVGQEELNQIAAEIQAIAEDCAPAWIEVIYCDTDVKEQATQRFAQGEQIALKAMGGGGTEFAPVFTYAIDLIEREDVAAVVYLTDLCGNVDACEDPGVPVLWGVTYPRNFDAAVPFGTVAPVELTTRS